MFGTIGVPELVVALIIWTVARRARPKPRGGIVIALTVAAILIYNLLVA
jgi:hypothetical protein